MSESEMAQGKMWIENTLRSIAAELDARIDTTTWGQVDGDFTIGRESLAYVLNGKRQVEKFSRADIEDCPNDNAVKARLDARLKQMIKSACSPTPKIGFRRT